MSADSALVYVVIDPNFGERLAGFPVGTPVWIVDSPVNSAVAHRLWRERPYQDHLTGITTFQGGGGATPEQIFLDNLDTIELHHGEYSSDPAYSEIEVVGAAVTDRIVSAIAELGFDRIHRLPEGFRATRHPSERENSD